MEKLAAVYLAQGMSMGEAAEACEISLDVLRRAIQHPLVEGEIARCRARAFPELSERLSRRLESFQEPALEEMGGLLREESPVMRFKASSYLLDHGPLGKQAQGAGEGGVHVHLDRGALEAILHGAMNAGEIGIVAAFGRLGPPLPPQGRGQEDEH